MNMDNVASFPLAGANGAASKPQDNRVIKVQFHNRPHRGRIVPHQALTDVERFDGKYSPAVRLGVLIAGTALTWGGVFALARLLLN
ncbi:hypothetical protein [Novosphingobium sp. KACC 22771]|uniref:hypothetical protein n=1 Tax=Novosphingobium sp. KACC 22771 TaxID=3025670 RepID=UPI002366B1C9|nr:hypothetical protein [Novosphingobium sp. KACC 22771]WDF72971.1 hypothetical protein PQ467_02705 [Novosphingobium sp. KACC 22771]